MAKITWTQTNTPGLRFKTVEGRHHGTQPDRYFTIRYRLHGKQYHEGIGWSSDEWTEKKAKGVVATLRSHHRTGEGWQTLKQSREQEQERQEQAEREQRQAQAEQEQAERLVYSALFAELCAELESDGKHTQVGNMQSRFKRWIQPHIGTRRVDSIQLIHLQKIKMALQKAGRSDQTIRHCRTDIQLVYSYARRHHIYTGDNALPDFLRGGKTDNARIRFLSSEEAGTLLEELKRTSTKAYRMALVSLDSGMRFSEIASLQWQHISTDSLVVLDPKNGSTRFVHLTSRLRSLFQEMRQELPEEASKAHRRGVEPLRGSRPDSLLFPPGKRNPTRPIMTQAPRAFYTAIKRLGFNDGIQDRRLKICFHSLRHTCASRLVNGGVALPVVAAVLGHKSLQQTQRYAHVTNDTVADAMDVLEQAAGDNKVLQFGGER